MNETQKGESGPEAFFSDWIKTSMAFWESVASTWLSFNTADGVTSDSKEDDKTGRFQKSWDISQKIWKTWSQMITESETIKFVFKETDLMQDIFLNIAQTGLDSFAQLQQQWLHKAGKFQESTTSYPFGNIDEDTVNEWKKLYETEFRKILNIPQLGLTRFYQEKMIRFADKFIIFLTDLSEFSRLLTLPIEKTFQLMQKKLAKLADEGNLPEDSKAYYRMWIKILEGHYMTLFQSSEYTKILNKTLHSMSYFSEAKKELLQDTLLYMLPVPTQKEMDELYKEIYLLKKRIKALEKRL